MQNQDLASEFRHYGLDLESGGHLAQPQGVGQGLVIAAEPSFKLQRSRQVTIP
jgi:hypothetical protein